MDKTIPQIIRVRASKASKNKFFSNIRIIINAFWRLILISVLLQILIPSLLFADSAEYLYDDVGRLIKVVSETGDAAIYNYDEVGNLISITKQTVNQNPPVLHGINPDIVFTGTYETSAYVLITGENLLTTNDVTADNPGIIISNVFAADTSITARVTISSDASVGQTNIKATTLYGSASIPLTLARLTLSPVRCAVTIGSTIDVTARIEGLTGDFNLPLNNKNPDIINAPQSIIVPAGGFTTFTVTALNEGAGIITAENENVTIYVTQPFTGNATASVAPVSAGWSDVPDGAVTALPVSVEWTYVPDGAVTALPVSVRKE